MFSIDGIPLHNPAWGWYVRPRTERFAEVSLQRSTLSLAGRHGVVGGVPATFEAPVLKIVVNVAKSGEPAIRALFTRSGAKLSLSSAPGLDAEFELMSLTPPPIGIDYQYIDITATVRIPGAFWRAAETTSAATALGSASVVASVLTGLTAPVQDATVRVKGPVTGVRVTDASGAWFSYPPSIPAGTSLLFTDGFAVLSTYADSNWDDYTSDVSGEVDFGGPRGGFELTPNFTNDPAVRAARLTVTSTARGAGAQIVVRGKAAHLV